MANKRNPYQNDARTKAARAAGYPARSVFKLEEIQKRTQLLKAGQRVLDLGAAPGSWSRYAARLVGASGRVLAIDLQAIDISLGNQVITIQGDALSPEQPEMLKAAPFDVVMSDMAPRTSGDKLRDRYLSYELAVGALEVACRLGKPGSHFIAKIFMSEDFPDAKKQVTERYTSCKIIRPDATRDVSTEVFLVGLGLKPAFAAFSAGPSGSADEPSATPGDAGHD